MQCLIELVFASIKITSFFSHCFTVEISKYNPAKSKLISIKEISRKFIFNILCYVMNYILLYDFVQSI